MKLKGLCPYLEQKFLNKADFYQKELTNTKKRYNTEKKKFEKERLENPIQITKDDILEIVSVKTNIPS